MKNSKQFARPETSSQTAQSPFLPWMFAMLNSTDWTNHTNVSIPREGERSTDCSGDQTPSEAETLLRRFNPELVGFGILDLHGESFSPSKFAGLPDRYLPHEFLEGCK